MSFNKLFLDVDKFICMYNSNDINRILKYDAIIYTDNKSQKFLKLYQEGKLDELKELILKNDKKTK